MPRLLRTFADQPAQLQTVVLGDQQYKIRFVYRERTRSWYMDLFDLDHNLIRGGGRLSPGQTIFQGIRDFPDNYPKGEFMVVGPHDQRQEDLGERLFVLFFTNEEIEELRQ